MAIVIKQALTSNHKDDVMHHLSVPIHTRVLIHPNLWYATSLERFKRQRDFCYIHLDEI